MTTPDPYLRNALPPGQRTDVVTSADRRREVAEYAAMRYDEASRRIVAEHEARQFGETLIERLRQFSEAIDSGDLGDYRRTRIQSVRVEDR